MTLNELNKKQSSYSEPEIVFSNNKVVFGTDRDRSFI